MEDDVKFWDSKNTLYIIVGVLVVASLGYRLIVLNNYEQSALLFVGLPALMAILMIRFTEPPNNVLGATFRVNIPAYFKQKIIRLNQQDL